MSGGEKRAGGRSSLPPGRGTTPQAIRVLIVEDERIVAEALSLSLSDEQDITVIGNAADRGSAIRAVATLAPDVVIMDQHLADGDGITTARDMHRTRPSLPIVMLTGDTSDELLLSALNAGMSGFLVKGDPFATLVTSVRRAAAGEMLWPADRLAKLLAQGRSPAAGDAAETGLTRRERDVLRLMAEGLDNKTIADRLGLTLATVRGYVQSVLKKLGAHSKLEAVVMASRTGLLREVTDRST